MGQDRRVTFFLKRRNIVDILNQLYSNKLSVKFFVSKK